MPTCRLSCLCTRSNLPLKSLRKVALSWQRFSVLRITTHSSLCSTSSSPKLSRLSPQLLDLSQLRFSWSVWAIKLAQLTSDFWTQSMLLRTSREFMEMVRMRTLASRSALLRSLLTLKRKRQLVMRTLICRKTLSLTKQISWTSLKVQIHTNSWQSSIR